MGTKSIKDDTIKVRLTKEQKELFKLIAKSKGITLSELVVVGTDEFCKRQKEKLDFKEVLEERSKRTDEKLIEIKERNLKKEKQLSNFSFFKRA